MAQLSNGLKFKIESLFGMASGYVLDFTNASFADFIRTSVGVDPYENYSGSKAQVLRQFWQQEPMAKTQQVLLELLDRWFTTKMATGGPSEAERQLYESAKIEVEHLVEVPISPTDQIFLGKDFGAIDLERVNVPVDFKRVIEQRLEEIDKCLEVKAPLATIFLCGSTLEGLLYEVASKNIESFNRCKAAPKSDGSVKTLNRWTLSDLIEAARELNVVGEDVSKHAMAVRAFRNYIHPRQQIKENFSPTMFTASMAKQVLLAAISDIQNGSVGGWSAK
jgi:hypothetical protein